MRYLSKLLFSPATMVLLLGIAGIGMAVATFLENDFGSAYARAVVYNAHWFEMVLFLLTLNLTGSIFERKLYRLNKFPVFVFHAAFVFILIGAGLTRYIGFEGIMHIREGEKSNILLTETKGYTVIDKLGKNLSYKGKMNESFSLKLSDESTVQFELLNHYPSALPALTESESGKPIVELVVMQPSGRTNVIAEQGKTATAGSASIDFESNNYMADIAIRYINDTFYIQARMPIQSVSMGGQVIDTTPVFLTTLTPQVLYEIGELRLVARQMLPKAELVPMPVSGHQHQGKAVSIFNCVRNGEQQKLYVWKSKDLEPEYSNLVLNNDTLKITYGRLTHTLPFFLKLDDFLLERYPGSMSPSSYSSFVGIEYPDKETRPFHIYMNNILKLDGFRFFQSSYDEDERGTILQVNYDVWGTRLTYFGYFFLIAGIVISLFLRNTFLRKVSASMVKAMGMIVLLLTIAGNTYANDKSSVAGIESGHADKFGELLIQDFKGRTEPVYTFASDLMRKISRKENIMGMSPVQVYLEMQANPSKWMDAQIIKVSNNELKKQLGISGSYISFNQCFPTRGQYVLQEWVNTAYSKSPGKQSKFDKDVIKVDERVNILYSVLSGSTLKVFPVPGSETNHWETADKVKSSITNSEDSMFVASILPVYFAELSKAQQSGDYSQADLFIEGIHKFQTRFSTYALPKEGKVRMELFYYKSNVFKKLFPSYATLGLILIILLIASIIREKPVNIWIWRGFSTLMIIGFSLHTIGLALRWYISGHAPMSNGYESMIFISWITILAGIVFSRHTRFALPATAIWGGFTLMVANLSFMDPEITNLVPVLKSYWLTVHVSVITGSYGFLGLGFIIGLINLILYMSLNENNKQRISDSIAELTAVGHKTLTFGLYMLTIGTFLGAVWANESWGRYWGWDPKETWSLITVIIYVLVTHARMIPGMKSMFTFNVLSVYAFGGVLMTYFGVNYYLSGLHSYAAGDPVPVPVWVYVAVSVLVALTYIASLKRKKIHKQSDAESVQ